MADTQTLEDGWYAVRQIGDGIVAIGEPEYYQRNWSYLFNGRNRSLLFDTGSYGGNITGVIERHATGDLTVLPSHMHFDHLGNVTRFGHVALADLEVLRACASGNRITPSDALFFGEMEDRSPPTFTVSSWLPVGSMIDLGGIVLEIIHTPGHSPDSISLKEPARNQLFVADFLYPGPLYAHLPGASLTDYLATARRLLTLVDDDTAIRSAHAGTDPWELPLQHRNELVALVEALERLREKAPAKLVEGINEIPVSATMALLTRDDYLKAFAAGRPDP